jgi:hypothetical protein
VHGCRPRSSRHERRVHDHLARSEGPCAKT